MRNEDCSVGMWFPLFLLLLPYMTYIYIYTSIYTYIRPPLARGPWTTPRSTTCLLRSTRYDESTRKLQEKQFGHVWFSHALRSLLSYCSKKPAIAGWCKCSQHTSMRHRIRNLIRRNTYGFAYNSFCSKQSCSNVCVKLRETFGNVLSVLVQQSISTLKW